VGLKIEYGSRTYMADSEEIMLRLFQTIVAGKFMFEKEEILAKDAIKGN